MIARCAPEAAISTMVLGLGEAVAEIGFLVQIGAPEMESQARSRDRLIRKPQ
jgi:hypothetical protein